MKHANLLRWSLLAWMILVLPMSGYAQTPAKHPTGYEYFSIGDVTATTPEPTSPGLLLMGGGREIKESFRWFAAHAGHGHIVILRASGDNALQNWIYHDVGGVTSVQTLIFHSRKPASDPKVLEIVRHADGIFIAGGDQSNYVRFWKGTPLNELLNEHVQDGKPLGGTSAGLAILGQWGYGAMDGRSLQSRQALDDPDGSMVTVVDHFLSLPLLHGTITDTHFFQRNRLGRLLVFVARIAKDDHTAAVTGLGIDQDSALLVEGSGEAKFLSHHPDGHAWIVIPTHLRKLESRGGRDALDRYLQNRLTPHQPLRLSGYTVIGIGTGSHLKLPDYTIENPVFRVRIDVVGQSVVQHVLQGEVPDALMKP